MYSLLPVLLGVINVTSAQELNISASIQAQSQQVTVYLALKVEDTSQPTSSALYKPRIKCNFQERKMTFTLNEPTNNLRRKNYFNYEFKTNQQGVLQCHFKQNNTFIKSNLLDIPANRPLEYRYLPNIEIPTNKREQVVKRIEKLIYPHFKVVEFGNKLIISTRLKYWPINYNDDWKNLNELNYIINTKLKPLSLEVTEVLSTNFCQEMEISPRIQIPSGQYNERYQYQDENGIEFLVQCQGNSWDGYQWNKSQIQAIKNYVEQQKSKLTSTQKFKKITTNVPVENTESDEVSQSTAISFEPIESMLTSSNQIETSTENVQSSSEKSTEMVRVSKSVTFPSKSTEDATTDDLNSFSTPPTKTNSELQTGSLHNRAISTRSPEDEINEILNSLNQLTALHNNMSDINSIQNFASTLTEVTNFSNKLLPPLANSLESIVSENEEILDELQRKNTSNQILESLDRLLLKVTNLGTGGFEEEVRSNIALRVEDLTVTQGVGIALIAAADAELRNLASTNTLQSLDRASNSESIRDLSPLAAVRLPDTLLRKSERVLFTVQSHGHLFSTSSRTSAIVSAELMGGPYENLPEPVRIYFQRDQAQRPRHGQCVSWDFSMNNGLGDWSSAGCKFYKTHYDSNATLHESNSCEEPKLEGFVLDECWCYHLTHFGELFIDHGFQVDTDQVLDTVSLVGVSLSLVGLTAVLITTFAFPKLIQRAGQKTKIQITSNLAVLLLLFLIASQLRKELPIPARVILGIAIHYSMLCNFSCMLIAAIMQYRRLIVVFSTDSPKLNRIYIVMAWVLPMVPPIVIIASGNYQAYCKPPLYLPQGLIFYLSLALPLLLVLVCNVAVFVIIAKSLYASTKIRKHGDHGSFVIRFRQLLFLFLLLGLSWIFALCQIVVPGHMVTVFSYLFCISIAIQGPAYFVFFVIMDKAAIREWKKLLCSKYSKDIVSETTTSTSKNNEKHTNESKITSESKV